MGVCAFVASGLDFDVDEYLRDSPFKPVSVFEKGSVPAKDNPERRPRPDSGFLVLVSQDEEPHLINQTRDALEFLAYHRLDIQALKEDGVDNLLLDFGITQQHVIKRPQYLPPELIEAMSTLTMGIIFSVIEVPEG